MMTFRSVRRKTIAPLLAVLVTVQTPTPARAWGRLGHRVIARLAESRLTPQAKASIAALLEPGESIADASLWADENRRDRPETAPWHYVDVPLDEPRYDARFSANDEEHGCVVDKINEFRKTVKDQTKTIAERRSALRFLLHCVEDLHMPMHVGENRDRGGNETQVVFYDDETNMHRLWDSSMIARVSQDEDVWLHDLTVLATPQSEKSEAAGTVEDWATESLLAARRAYDDPITGQRIVAGAKLGDVYFNNNLPVVRERLRQAGVRLAMVLNEIWAEH
jgi:hypothetical protein